MAKKCLLNHHCPKNLIKCLNRTMNLTLNPKTKDEIDIFLGSPTHALLLVGPLGSGKGALASFIATKVLDVSENRLEVYPHFRRLITTGSSISIEDVRNLHNFTSL